VTRELKDRIRAGGVLLLAARATPTGGLGEPSGPASDPAPATADPVVLIGLWTVTEADEEKGAVLRLAAGDLLLVRARGQIMGHWRATTDGLFVAHTFSSSGRRSVTTAARWPATDPPGGIAKGASEL
jgi:hypothetical protein